MLNIVMLSVAMLNAILLSVAMLIVMMVIVIKRNFLAVLPFLNVLKLAAHHSTREDGSDIRYEPLWGVKAPDSDAYKQNYEFIF